MTRPTCATCASWTGDSTGQGECRRRSPVIAPWVEAAPNRNCVAAWPVTHALMSCGDYEGAGRPRPDGYDRLIAAIQRASRVDKAA